MANQEQQPASWCGHYTFAPGQTACWNIGPLTMFVQRLEKEWKVVYGRDEAHINADLWDFNPQAGEPADDLEIKQAFDRENIEIRLPHVTLYSGSVTEPFPIRVVDDRDATS